MKVNLIISIRYRKMTKVLAPSCMAMHRKCASDL
jgi:hypothetical protein